MVGITFHRTSLIIETAGHRSCKSPAMVKLSPRNAAGTILELFSSIALFLGCDLEQGSLVIAPVD